MTRTSDVYLYSEVINDYTQLDEVFNAIHAVSLLQVQLMWLYKN